MKDEGGNRATWFRLRASWVYPQAYRDSYEFRRAPRHLAGDHARRRVGRVVLLNFEITRDPAPSRTASTSAFTLNSRQEIVVGLSRRAR